MSRGVGMSMSIRRLTAFALSGAAAGLLLLPAAGQAATIFGSRLDHEPTEKTCSVLGPCTIVSFIHPIDPNGDPYSGGAPVSGVITKFRYIAFADEAPGQVTFRVANISRPNPEDQDNALATAVGTGPTVMITPSESP